MLQSEVKFQALYFSSKMDNHLQGDLVINLRAALSDAGLDPKSYTSHNFHTVAAAAAHLNGTGECVGRSSCVHLSSAQLNIKTHAQIKAIASWLFVRRSCREGWQSLPPTAPASQSTHLSWCDRVRLAWGCNVWGADSSTALPPNT